MVRGVYNLPNGSGRTVTWRSSPGPKADEARAAGADIVGAEDLVEIVSGGTIEFDRCIATPDMMPLVGRLGRCWARGLMPNPKVGTVTMDVKGAVAGAKGGAVEFRVEKAGIVHAGIGKASFEDGKLVENIKAFADAVAKAKPSGAKGTTSRRLRFLDHGPGREGRSGERAGRLTWKALLRRRGRRRPGGTSFLPDLARGLIGSRPALEGRRSAPTSGHRGKGSTPWQRR